jgi:tetratricopeptide (TPR) repeat protein
MSVTRYYAPDLCSCNLHRPRIEQFVADVDLRPRTTTRPVAGQLVADSRRQYALRMLAVQWAIISMIVLATMLLAAVGGCQHHAVTTADDVSMWQSQPNEPEAISLLGKPLIAPELPSDVHERRLANLAEAKRQYEAQPDDIERIVWVGRRQAYLGRYRDAVATFSRGLQQHPDSPHLLRHRGHRFITLRRFEDAVADFERAALQIDGMQDEVEPDGLPNVRGEPRSTLHTNIHYHHALALYLLGRYDEAAEAWRACWRASANDDMRVAAGYWLYLAAKRAGRTDLASWVLRQIERDMDVIENRTYHTLLLLYKGELTVEEVSGGGGDSDGLGVDDATLGYGIGTYHHLNGNHDRASAIFRGIVESTNWAAFGHIAAEAELARSPHGR